MRKDVLSLLLFAVPGARSKPHPLKLDDGQKRKLLTALKPGRHLRLHNGIHLDENNLIVHESHRRRLDDEENGEEACESQGFNEAECSTVGCCHWNMDQCWSSVGAQLCHGYYHDDGDIDQDDMDSPSVDGDSHSDDGDSHSDDGDSHSDDHHSHSDDGAENGEEACENQGFNEAECSTVGCCHWNMDQCWSSVGTAQCYIYYADDDGFNVDDGSYDFDDAFDDDGDYYTDDYDGTDGDDELFEFLFSLSPMCTLSYFSLLDNLEEMPVPNPGLVMTDSAIGFDVDFSVDKEEYEMFLSTCTKIGGQSIVVDMGLSDSCMSPNYLNLPSCVGASCDEDDVIKIGSAVSDSASDPSLEDCTVSTEVKSLEGTSDIGVSASDVCLEDMMSIFILGDVYENFDDEITLDEETGELTGDIEEFTKICESTGGRIVLGTVVYNDDCGEDGFSSVPVCVARTCGNDEAISFLEYFLIATNNDTSCVDVKLSTEETDSGTDSETSSKSTKSSKKGEKSVKTAKLTKSPKAAKTAKSGEKSEKAPKADRA